MELSMRILVTRCMLGEMGWGLSFFILLTWFITLHLLPAYEIAVERQIEFVSAFNIIPDHGD